MAHEFDNDAHAGVDLKYGVTPSLTLDVTVEPDFAQAEADEQQVNLTQFSLFFPEKREFFLENSGMFYFGDIPRESRLGNARFAPPEEEMLLFFSRADRPDQHRRSDSDRRRRSADRAGRPHRSRADDDSDAVRRMAATATTTRCCAAVATCCATGDIGANLSVAAIHRRVGPQSRSPAWTPTFASSRR